MIEKKDNLSDLATSLAAQEELPEQEETAPMMVIDNGDDELALAPGQVLGSQGEIITLQPNQGNIHQTQTQRIIKK